MIISYQGSGEVEPFIDSLLNAADILLVKILEMTPKIIEGLSKITKSIIEKNADFFKNNSRRTTKNYNNDS